MPDFTDADEDRQPPSAVVLPVTCARDGREHLVAEDEMAPGSAGRYMTLCGHRMLAAVLACPPGPPCPQCIKVHTPAARNRRANRPGVWARLTAWLTPARRQPRAAQLEPAPSPVTVVPPPPVHRRGPR